MHAFPGLTVLGGPPGTVELGNRDAIWSSEVAHCLTVQTCGFLHVAYSIDFYLIMTGAVLGLFL